MVTKLTLLAIMASLFSITSIHAQTVMVDAGPDLTICQGDTVMLQGSVVNGTPQTPVMWSCNLPSCNFDNPNIETPMVMGLPVGCTEFVMVTFDFFGGVADSDTMEVCVNPAPIVSYGPDISICGGNAPCQILNPTISNAPGPYTYNWIPGSGLNDSTIFNPCARPAITTTYSLIATSLLNGCSTPYTPLDTSTTITVNVINPIAEAGANDEICEGDTTVLQGSGFFTGTGTGGPFSFEWSPIGTLSDPNIASPLAFPSSTSFYYLTVWSGGCPSYSDSVLITVIPTPPQPTISFSGDTLISSSADVYQWCLNGNPIPGATNQWHLPQSSGDYQVKVSFSFAPFCNSVSTILTGSNQDVRRELELWPNPISDGQFNIRIPGNIGILHCDILEISGRIVFSETYSGELNSISAPLEKGLYLVKIYSEEGLFYKKISVQ